MVSSTIASTPIMESPATQALAEYRPSSHLRIVRPRWVYLAAL
jgi:hypothetical protein